MHAAALGRPLGHGAAGIQLCVVGVCRDRTAYVAVDSSGPGLDAVRRGGPLWLVKPNREELAELAGRPVETDLQMREAAESLLTQVENLSASDSRIRDADFAQETAQLTRNQILVAAGTSVLTIANNNPQTVLRLLQG